MALSWDKRRSSFNHDWLKNRYLPALEKWLNVLDGEVEDGGFQERFLSEFLGEWEVQREVVAAIVKDYESAVSPRILFVRPPLSRCNSSTKAWLPLMVHLLWLQRYDVPELIREQLRRIEQVDAKYRALKFRASETAGSASEEDLRKLRRESLEFFYSCSDLARSISSLPSEVKVI